MVQLLGGPDYPTHPYHEPMTEVASPLSAARL